MTTATSETTPTVILTPARIVGRRPEIATLNRLLASNRAEFLAIYGRRRVGKTFLIRRFFEDIGVKRFMVTGKSRGKMREQLRIFQKAVEDTFYGGQRLPDVKTWDDAFALLVAGVRQIVANDPKVKCLLFLDELPWLHTRRSGLLDALDHAWNTELSQIQQVKLVVCGSAASWMIKNIEQAKGGLHNRLTETIQLRPFTLGETRDMLHDRGIEYAPAQVIELFLVLGGVPFYLDLIRRGESPSKAVSRLCFAGGSLHGEFDKLFKALFEDGDHHEQLVRALATKRRGLTRNELLKATKIKTGGRVAQWLKELEEAGFIAPIAVTEGRRSTVCYRVIDEFTLFYLRWIEGAGKGPLGPAPGQDHFMMQRQTQEYESWSGYAFEAVCLKHIEQINAALGISRVLVKPSVWQKTTKTTGPSKGGISGARGAQIDLVLDRADGMTTLCEIKYYDEQFEITKSYADNLRHKLNTYKAETKTKNSVMLVFISPSGLVDNEYARQLVTHTVTASDLLES